MQSVALLFYENLRDSAEESLPLGYVEYLC